MSGSYASRRHLEIGDIVVGRYELTAEIGRGGCAIVFEAHDHRLGRVVALKVPVGFGGDSAKVSRFNRESRVIASIHHPNVCAVLDSGEAADGTPFLVMERLYGESLRARVAKGRLGVTETLAIGLQLLSALDAVHAAGIVHRDIKPDNIILVTRGGCDPLVKLLDFGLCRASTRQRGDGEEETHTIDGAIIGTPEYMAPEQVLGRGTLDVRVDLYAVGVVLYEALTGDRTFFARNVRDILTAVMSKRVSPLRQLRRDAPPRLEAILARAMERRPQDRYASATDFQQDLVDVRAEISAISRKAQAGTWDAPTTRYEKPVRRVMRRTGSD